MKKLILVFLIFLIPLCAFAFPWSKKEKPVLILSSKDPREQGGYDEKIEPVSVFRTGDKIYFGIYTPNGFKSDYIRYQIVKQDDNAHDMGYSRIRNATRRVYNKNSYVDYFILYQKGKYYIQVFDIENLQQWIAIGAFRVVDE